MDERLYKSREVIKLRGREVEIPVVSNHPEHQEMYRSYRLRGFSHEQAEQAGDDDWQTRFYDDFVVVAAVDGNFIRVPVAYQDKPRQQAYQSLRQTGESHNSAVMTVERKGPAIGLCDTRLLRTPIMHGNQFEKDGDRGNVFRKKAESAGVSTTGKFYHPGIATELGDPEAWVGSISDIKDVCKRRGWDFSVKEGEMKIGIKADLSKDLWKQFGRKAKKPRKAKVKA